MSQTTSCTVPTLGRVKGAILRIIRENGYVPDYPDTSWWLYNRMTPKEQPRNRLEEPRLDLVSEALSELTSEGRLKIEEFSYVPSKNKRRRNRRRSRKNAAGVERHNGRQPMAVQQSTHLS